MFTFDSLFVTLEIVSNGFDQSKVIREYNIHACSPDSDMFLDANYLLPAVDAYNIDFRDVIPLENEILTLLKYLQNAQQSAKNISNERLSDLPHKKNMWTTNIKQVNKSITIVPTHCVNIFNYL